MKRLPLILLVLVCCTAGRAGSDFLRTLTPEERTAAGLQKQTPEELEKLQALVERYKAGEVAVVHQQTEEIVSAAQKEAAAQVAAAKQEAEAKAAAAEARAAAPAAAKPAGKQPGWVGALALLKRVSERPDRNEAMESSIAGDFEGWTSRTLFRLENGQIWQQSDSDSYYGGIHVKSPKVRIVPGLLGTFWMEVEGIGPRVKVKPVKLD